MTNYGYRQQVGTTNAGTNPAAGAYDCGSGFGTGYSPYGQQFATISALPNAGTMTGTMPGMMPAAGGAAPPAVPSGAFVTPGGGSIVTVPAVEESYVENILRLNRGKLATFYMTYENNREWNAKIFKGVIEAAGRDHIIISDPATGMRFLLLMLNLDYVTFSEPINYEYPFNGGTVTQSTPMGG